MEKGEHGGLSPNIPRIFPAPIALGIAPASPKQNTLPSCARYKTLRADTKGTGVCAVSDCVLRLGERCRNQTQTQLDATDSLRCTGDNKQQPPAPACPNTRHDCRRVSTPTTSAHSVCSHRLKMGTAAVVHTCLAETFVLHQMHVRVRKSIKWQNATKVLHVES